MFIKNIDKCPLNWTSLNHAESVAYLIEKDINDNNGKQRDRNKMKMILRSLARNESTLVGSKTIVKDIEDYENDDELVKIC